MDSEVRSWAPQRGSISPSGEGAVGSAAPGTFQLAGDEVSSQAPGPGAWAALAVGAPTVARTMQRRPARKPRFELLSKGELGGLDIDRHAAAGFQAQAVDGGAR